MSKSERQPQKQTLLKTLGSKTTTKAYLDAMSAFEKIRCLADQERKTLFYYYLWEQADGSFAPIKEFGEMREDIPLILDRVMESDYLADAYDKFTKTLAGSGKRAEEFLILLGEGLDPKEAIEELGLNLEKDERGKTNHEKFIDFCRQVEIIENPVISDEEIAKALAASPTRVKRARKRLREEGKARQRTAAEVSMSNSRRLFPIRAQIKRMGLGKSVKEMSESTGATESQVLHQRAILFREKEIRKRTRNQTRKRLKKILNNYMQKNPPGTPINLSQLHRDFNLGVSWSTIQTLYHEIEATQAVPVLKYNPRKKLR